MSLLVICHFYNDESIMPFWLDHTTKLFDHGIMIDYGCTDKSIEYIRSMAPQWWILKTKNRYFDDPGIALEVMEIEQKFNGWWKACLNVTEFIMHPNLRMYTKMLEEAFPEHVGVRCNGVIMVDNPQERNQLSLHEPLLSQKTYGYFEDDVFTNPNPNLPFPRRSRSRLLHRAPHGAYGMGRHETFHQSGIDPNLFCCWFGWCPFDSTKHRKKQPKLTASPARQSHPHFQLMYDMDDEKIERCYEIEYQRSYSLLSRPNYKAAWEQYKQFRTLCPVNKSLRMEYEKTC